MDNVLAIAWRLAVVCAALPVASIAAESGCGERPAMPVPEYTDPGTPIQASAGSVFVLVLESNRTTGYRWELAAAPDSAVVKLISSEYMATPPQRIGSGGREYWRFEAAAAGEAAIGLRYIRPWEKSKPPAREAQFRVTVSPAVPGREVGQAK